MKKLFVCFLAVALVCAFTVPAMSADWNFYGNTRFQTFSHDRDKEAISATATESDTDTVWLMQNNSRFGGKVAAGDISGHIEVAAASVSSGSTDNIGLRHLTGTWNFGAGSLLIGHTWAVITNLLSNQIANQGQGMLGWGSVYQGRRDQIRLTFGGLKIGLLSPTTSGLSSTTGTTPTGYLADGTAVYGAKPVNGDVDVTLPKIEVAYRFATDMFWVEPYIGYQTYDRQYSTTTATTDVTSFIYGAKGKVNFGPAYVGLGLTLGTNPAEYGLAVSATNVVKATLVNNTYEDVDYMEYMGLVGFKMNDMVTFEAGYGEQKMESDPNGIKTEYDRFTYYVNADITLAPGVHVIPEYSKFDNGSKKVTGATDVELGTESYIGAKWQINF